MGSRRHPEVVLTGRCGLCLSRRLTETPFRSTANDPGLACVPIPQDSVSSYCERSRTRVRTYPTGLRFVLLRTIQDSRAYLSHRTPFRSTANDPGLACVSIPQDAVSFLLRTIQGSGA